MTQRVTSVVLAEVLVDALKKSADAGDERTAYLLAAVAFRQLEITLPPPSGADGADGGAAGCLLAVVEGEQERFLERLAAKRKADNERNAARGGTEAEKIQDRFKTDSEPIRDGIKTATLTLSHSDVSSTGVDERGAQGAQFALEAEEPQTKAEKAKKPRAATFIPPTADEVRAFVEAQGLAVDAARFVDKYTSQGWKLSNGLQMKDWKAAVRLWARMDADGRAGWNHSRAAITQLGSGGGEHGDY